MLKNLNFNVKAIFILVVYNQGVSRKGAGPPGLPKSPKPGSAHQASVSTKVVFTNNSKSSCSTPGHFSRQSSAKDLNRESNKQTVNDENSMSKEIRNEKFNTEGVTKTSKVERSVEQTISKEEPNAVSRQDTKQIDGVKQGGSSSSNGRPKLDKMGSGSSKDGRKGLRTLHQNIFHVKDLNHNVLPC